jgi:putative transcriptional regulator
MRKKTRFETVSLSKRLRNFRKDKGLTMKQVADRLGIASSTYRDWEYGRAILGEPYLQLAQIFEVSLKELMVGDKESPQHALDILREIESALDRMKVELSTLF